MRFNPRSPCGGATSQPTMPRIRRLFQPPLPLRGATPDEFYVRCLGWLQPTLPWRGATRSPRKLPVTGQVSTHAPLAGSDLLHVAHLLDVQASTPRSPCGERRSRPRAPPGRASFNPRSPCGERLLHLVNVALRAYHMHDVFHPNASSDELRPSETNQKAVRTSQGIPDSPQFAPPIIPTAYS